MCRQIEVISGGPTHIHTWSSAYGFTFPRLVYWKSIFTPSEENCTREKNEKKSISLTLETKVTLLHCINISTAFLIMTTQRVV